MGWFEELSKPAQKAYIEAHPRSKYAKMKPGPSRNNAGSTKAAMAKDSIQAAMAPFRKKQPTASMLYHSTAMIKQYTGVVAKILAKLTSLKSPSAILKAKIKLKETKEELKKHKNIVGNITGKTKASTVTTKLKAHDKKVATDKNKVIAKTPSAKVKPKTGAGQHIAMTTAIAKKRAALREAVAGSSAAKRLTAQLTVLLSEQKAFKAKIKASLAKRKAVVAAKK